MKKLLIKKILTFILALMIAVFPFTASAASNSADEDPTPKYIFIIIGDGMGFGHLEIGKLFSKVMSGDMSAGPVWADFPTQIAVKAGVDSSQGGTMIATGTTQSAGPISVTDKGKALPTILDVAKKNGLSTGVISTTSLVDATPATFLTHALSRSNHDTMISGIVDSGVNFIAGGGLDMMFTEKDIPDEYKKGASGDPVTRYAKENIAYKMERRGYDTYLGLPGAKAFLEQEEFGDKTLAVFTRSNLSFLYLRQLPQYREKMQFTPSLADIVEKGILSLSANEDGFCVMIEEGAIDDACHAENPKYIAAEMGEMERTVNLVMDFYNQHPDETLVIITADHETGGFTFGEGNIDSLSDISETLPWDGSATDIRDFVYRNFRASTSAATVKNGVEYIHNDTFGNDFDNRLIAAAEITAKAQFELGIRQQHSYHSHQDVPLMAIGAGSEAFSSCESIADISHVICEVAGWRDTLEE